jgi:PAS domain S-box-containing protein
MTSALVDAERDFHRDLGHTVLLTLDARGCIKSINAAGCELLGARQSALVGHCWIEVVFGPGERERARAEFEKVVQRRPGQTHEYAIGVRRASGDTRPMHWKCLAVRDGGGAVAGYLCSGEDLADSRCGESDARRAAERLDHVSRIATISEMAAGIAHELNQPLTAIANYARACERFVTFPHPDLDEARGAAREIGKEAMRAGDIIRRLRQLARVEDNELLPSDINEIVGGFRELTLADAGAQGTRLTFELGNDIPAIMADRAQITRVLLNLVRNALESLRNAPADQRQIRVTTRRTAHGDVEIDVCDNGHGVDPRVQDRLFDPFSTTKPDGAGLGLPMSRTIIRAHGGVLAYLPLRPRGACFRITLPAADSQSS